MIIPTYLSESESLSTPPFCSFSLRNLRSSEPSGVARSRFHIHVALALCVASENASGVTADREISGQFSSFHRTQFLSRDKTVSTTLANAGPSCPTLSALLMDFLVSIAHLVYLNFSLQILIFKIMSLRLLRIE